MRIVGTGSALPERVVTNDELASFLDTSDAWIRTRTGIETRRIMTRETLDELAGEAARAALQNAGCAADSLDFILCSTVRGEYITPGMGCLIQRAIGAKCPALDLNGACAGFLYGLWMAEAMILSGKARRVLLVCAEAMTRFVDWTDRSNCVLFGDGAGAVVLDGEPGFLGIRLTTMGDSELLKARAFRGNCPYTEEPTDFAYLQMAGQAVYRFAVSSTVEDIRALLADVGLEPDQVDHYLLHQANLRILEAVRARFKLDAARFPHNIERRGNTSSASIPILLDELNRERRLKAGDTLVFAAFGAGLATGAAALRWA